MASLKPRAATGGQRTAFRSERALWQEATEFRTEMLRVDSEVDRAIS